MFTTVVSNQEAIVAVGMMMLLVGPVIIMEDIKALLVKWRQRNA